MTARHRPESRWRRFPAAAQSDSILPPQRSILALSLYGATFHLVFTPKKRCIVRHYAAISRITNDSEQKRRTERKGGPMSACRFNSKPARTVLAFLLAAIGSSALAQDAERSLERTCFQTAKGWAPQRDLKSDVAIVYGIDTNLPRRIATWREHGYRIHVMTGVAWGEYQDYLYGRFDGINHEDEAQTDREGRKIGHGGDVYYMCPGTNYGKFLCVGVQRALDAGAEAIHLEEPEFWDRGGYSEGFKREWRGYYHEDWQAPDSSVDARWRAGKLKYFLYRRALQQVFDFVQDYNKKTGRHVHCYVPTHSLVNYAQWCIVSPESSLAQLQGCDGYIAQVWTGTSREPNRFVSPCNSSVTL